MAEPIKALGIQGVGRVRAKQVEGVPNHPVHNLWPCATTDGVHWAVDNRTRLSVGTMFNMSGTVTFAPTMIDRMRIASFRVGVQIDAYDERCKYKLRLMYSDKDEDLHEQVSGHLSAADVDQFRFEIPLEHLNRTGWFAAALTVQLLTDLEGPERDAALAAGRESPKMPVLLRGSWLEIRA